MDSVNKEFNKIIVANGDFLVDKILSCPDIKFSSSQTSGLDGVQFGISLSNFAQQLGRKKADVKALLEVAGISPTLIPTQNAKAKERERERASWLFFQNLTFRC